MKKKLMIMLTFLGVALLPVLLIGTVALVGGGSTSILADDDCYNGGTVPIDDKGTEQNAQSMYDHWKTKYHATKEGASGILGVLQFESQLNPKAVNSGSGATGIAQWLGGRKTALDELAKRENKPDTDLGVQLDYLDQELATSYQTSKAIFQQKDVHKAAYDWLMSFEGMSLNPEQWFLPQRYVFADHWESVLKGDSPSGGTDDSGTSNDTIDCSSTADDGEILTTAKKWLGWFHYDQVHPSPDLGLDLKNPKKEGHTDCSGFVWLVLNKCGYKVPKNMQWFTGTMTSDARGKHQYLQVESDKEAQVGDIVIVNQGAGGGDNGHTAILLEKWHGNDTKIIEQGGVGDSVNTGTFGSSFLDLLNGGDICLARAKK